MSRQTVYIALGGNIEPRLLTLGKAVETTRRLEGTEVLRVSRWFDTAPVGGPPGQQDYLNGVAEIATLLSPLGLLAALQDIERLLGRVRVERWGPRTCDLDIILFGDMVMDSEQLTIPHPRMHRRAFVLAPLAELAPDLMHPVLGKTVSQLLRELKGGG